MELMERRRAMMGAKSESPELLEIVIENGFSLASGGKNEINRLLSAKGKSSDNTIIVLKDAENFSNAQVLAISTVSFPGASTERFLRIKDGSYSYYQWGSGSYDAVAHRGDTYVVIDLDKINSVYRTKRLPSATKIVGAGTLSNFLKTNAPDTGFYLVYRQITQAPVRYDFAICLCNSMGESPAISTGVRFSNPTGTEGIKAWTNNYNSTVYAGDNLYYVPLPLN